MEAVLAGTSYVAIKRPDYYLVATSPHRPVPANGRIIDETSSPSATGLDGYLVYRPISMAFFEDDRRDALMAVAADADIRFTISPDVTGTVSVEFQNVPLDTAFKMLLAGTPFTARNRAGRYEIVRQATPEQSRARAFNWLVNADEMTPLEYLSQLTQANAVVAEVFGYRPGWVKEEHLPALLAQIGSSQPRPCPMAGSVSPIMGVSSTIGREAALLIRSFWTGQYPAPYREIISEADKEELRARWRQHQEEHSLLDGPVSPLTKESGARVTERVLNKPAEAPPEQFFVSIALRILSVGDTFVDAMRQGLPIEEVASPNDLDVLGRIGRQLDATGQVILNNEQRDLLLRTLQARPDSRNLAAPRVTVLSGEAAHFSLGREHAYIAGYTAPRKAPTNPRPGSKKPGSA